MLKRFPISIPEFPELRMIYCLGHAGRIYINTDARPGSNIIQLVPPDRNTP